jgi:hypothetical protein
MQPCAYEHNRTAGVSDTMLAALPSRAEYLAYSTTEILGSENYKRLSSCPSHARQTRVLRSITYFCRALSHKGVSPHRKGLEKVLSSW